jgi:hypothetical protein
MKLRSNANGLVLLHGCEVGSGEDGAQLVRSLSLTIQNSVSVMACRHKTRWINDNEKVKFGRTWLNKFWPALHSPNRRLQGGDMIGYMGVQPLGQTQMQNLLDTTCITPKAPVQPQNNAKK